MEKTKFQLGCEYDEAVARIRLIYESEVGDADVHVRSRDADGLIYITSGEAVYTFSDGGVQTARPGDVIFLARSSRYDRVMERGTRLAYVCADFFFAEPSTLFTANRVYSFRDPALAGTVFRRLLDIWRRGGFAHRIYARAALCELFGLIAKNELSSYMPRDRVSAVLAAVETIRTGCSDPAFSTGGLAASLGLSEVHLRRLFKDVTHMTPVQYLNMTRVERAKALIAQNVRGESHLSISDISKASGFSEPYYFSRVFKKLSSLSPAAFEKLLRGDVGTGSTGSTGGTRLS